MTTDTTPPVYVNREEQEYLGKLRKAMQQGVGVPTRNGDRFTLIGETLRFSLANYTLPLMTVRKLPFKAIVRELRWFLSGQTNVKSLHAENCYLWDQWAVTQQALNAAYESGRAFPNDETAGLLGSIGPMYGAQWNAPLRDNETQLTRLIRELKARPYSTQHLLTSYSPNFKMDETMSCSDNVLDGRGALTPCHGIHTQFICLPPAFPNGLPRLYCTFTNRSQDMPVGTAFNIAMYALLAHIIAYVCGFEATELVWFGSHCHIYPDQLGSIELMLERPTYKFPQVSFAPGERTLERLIESSDNFVLHNYECGEVIKVPVTG